MRAVAVPGPPQRPGARRPSLLLMLLFLAGCGQTGPLYLPEPAPAAPVEATEPAEDAADEDAPRVDDEP
jgi:predicted small lipoprotein YifL